MILRFCCQMEWKCKNEQMKLHKKWAGVKKCTAFVGNDKEMTELCRKETIWKSGKKDLKGRENWVIYLKKY